MNRSCMLLGLAAASFASGAWVADVVRLKDGGRVQGTVMEEDPASGATIQLADGTLRKVTRPEIASISYETSAPALTMPSPRPHVERDTETRGIKPLWLTGLVTLAVVYPITVATTVGLVLGYRPDEPVPFAVEGCIPVIGPWIFLAAHPNPPSGVIAGYALSGVAQGLALTSIILGASLRMPQRKHQFVDDAMIVPWTPPANDGGGVGLIGRF